MPFVWYLSRSCQSLSDQPQLSKLIILSGLICNKGAVQPVKGGSFIDSLIMFVVDKLDCNEDKDGWYCVLVVN